MMTTKSATLIAIKRLQESKLVAVPTETVYGLAARIDDPMAIESIFITKERPFFDPLIVHVSSIKQAKELTTHWSDLSDLLATTFWPGPLTMILPRHPSVNPMITSGLDSVGIRMPNHQLTLELIEKLEKPIAAPSANKFGRTSPSCAKHVMEEFQNDDVFVLDGGECQIGIESTVLLIKAREVDNAEKLDKKYTLSILRKGHISKGDIEALLSHHNFNFEFIESPSKKDSPGHMKHHYMPQIPLFIVTKESTHDELLCLINNSLDSLPDEIESVKIIKPQTRVTQIIPLELSVDPLLACRELYTKMRLCAEQRGMQAIYFEKKEYHNGERWESLFDRLNKAATLIF